MPAIFTIKAIELSTYGVHVDFYDENSAAMVPNSLYWSLSDNDGTIINDHSGTAITSVQSSIDIVLSGSDLSISSGTLQAEVDRVLTLWGNYNSDLGNGLPYYDRLRFPLINLSAV